MGFYDPKEIFFYLILQLSENNKKNVELLNFLKIIFPYILSLKIINYGSYRPIKT